MFEYFREKIPNNGILFLQETHSSHDTVINLRDGFKGELLFSNGTTNSCGVMIGYLGSNKTKVNKTKIDNQGRILIVVPGIDKERFVLFNLYHANADMVQIETTYELNQLLSDFCLNSDEKVILQGISIYSMIQVWKHQVVKPL